MNDIVNKLCKREVENIIRADRLSYFLENNVVISQKEVIKEGVLYYKIKSIRYSLMSYGDLVNKLVKQKYSDSEEFAILRKSVSSGSNAEFVEYNVYVEECKAVAKAYINERVALFGK